MRIKTVFLIPISFLVVATLIFMVWTKTVRLPVSNKRGVVPEGTWPTPEILSSIRMAKLLFEQNFFDSPMGDGRKWLSVSSGPYSGQFYSRDTFVSILGAVYMGHPVREELKGAIWWFSNHMDGDGYIPLWFRKTTDLNVYRFSPYNKGPTDGGVKQVDHILEYIDGIWLLYSWEGDQAFLDTYLPYAEKAWKYIDNQTNQYLIDAPASKFAGLDWADKMLREGESTFVESYWYRATTSLAYLEKSANREKEYKFYLGYAAKIKSRVNETLWKVSDPVGYVGRPFGHYVAWVKDGRTRDYFEVDSNAMAVMSGAADWDKGQSVADFIFRNSAQFVNNVGASRVLLGEYEKADMYGDFLSGEYQNGGYWYIVSYPVSKALAVYGYSNELQRMLTSTLATVNASPSSGLAEWYKPDGSAGGALNYSWSLTYPYFLVYNSILGVETNAEGLLIKPTLPSDMRKIYFQIEYRGKTLSIYIDYAKHKEIFIKNNDLKRAQGDNLYLNYQ